MNMTARQTGKFRPIRCAYDVALILLGGYFFGWGGAVIVIAALLDIEVVRD